MNWGYVLQAVVAFGLLNVWLVRFHKSTAYRGGDAKNLREEFLAYGLPTWAFYLVGTLKIGSALALLSGFWASALVRPASGLVTVLMIGALAMHFKVGDRIIKSLPAAIMLLMALALFADIF